MKKKLYLYVLGEGCESFEYEKLSDLKSEFDKRLIRVGENEELATMQELAKMQ